MAKKLAVNELVVVVVGLAVSQTKIAICTTKSIKPMSYSRVVLYIRDHEGLDFLTKNITQNQLNNTFLAPWQHWLGINKPKSAFIYYNLKHIQ